MTYVYYDTMAYVGELTSSVSRIVNLTFGEIQMPFDCVSPDDFTE